MTKTQQYEFWARMKCLVGDTKKPHYCIYDGVGSVFYYDVMADRVRVCEYQVFRKERYEKVMKRLYRKA